MQIYAQRTFKIRMKGPGLKLLDLVVDLIFCFKLWYCSGLFFADPCVPQQLHLCALGLWSRSPLGTRQGPLNACCPDVSNPSLVASRPLDYFLFCRGVDSRGAREGKCHLAAHRIPSKRDKRCGRHYGRQTLGACHTPQTGQTKRPCCHWDLGGKTVCIKAPSLSRLSALIIAAFFLSHSTSQSTELFYSLYFPPLSSSLLTCNAHIIEHPWVE
jgi:hypothetical protein